MTSVCQGLSSLALGGGKMRDPRKEVDDFEIFNIIFLQFFIVKLLSLLLSLSLSLLF